MDQDERPEDERRPEGIDEPSYGSAEGPSEDQGVLDELLDSADDDADPASGSTPPQEPPPEDDGGDGYDDGGKRSLFLRSLLVVAPIFLVALLLIGWNRVASSDDFCATCHEMEQSTNAASRSVHDDVPCLACHTRPGLLGTLRYLPTLARETIHKFTAWDIAGGVLDARECGSCHTGLAATPELAAAHGTGEECSSCHGDTAHPPFRLAGFERPAEPITGDDPHPVRYVQTHGEDVAKDPGSCVECHDAKFCETCHFRSTYPHPKGWIEQHGQQQIAEGAEACTLCHPQTFCAGCHGTEIPHRSTWLGEHWRDLRDASTDPCLVCHPRTDCTDCHSRHGVHREQSLYA